MANNLAFLYPVEAGAGWNLTPNYIISVQCTFIGHRTLRKIEMAKKNIQSISRLLRERPHSGLRNEPPLDSLDPQSQNPFMASPSPDPIQRLAIKGFRD